MNVPNPADEADRTARRNAGPGDAADHPVTGTVHELLEEVEQVRGVTGDEFELGAVSRQAELLSRAHDALAEALEDVGRG